MTTACPIHPHVRLQGPGQPESRFFRIVHRIADRFGPEVAAAFLDAVEETRDNIDLGALESAIQAADMSQVESVLKVGSLRERLAARDGMEGSFTRSFAATGQASAEVLEDALGVAFSFDARDPRAILFARSQSSTLIKGIGDDALLSVRAIMGRAFSEGIPPEGAARLIREVVGLRRDHSAAVTNFFQDLRVGQEGGDELVSRALGSVDRRRLDAATKAKLRKALREGTLTDDMIEEAVQTYRTSLLNYRAQSIARTETIRSASAGQHESFLDARRQGVIPETARRAWIVTPDDRLRDSHAAIPDLNADFVGIDEPFETPMGPIMYPPAGVMCRCGIGLIPNPNQPGII